MAGILIYTAGPDSEGSLGGLVEMSRPELLGPILDRALREARLCANDPLCADREPGATGTQLNGAACHACLLAGGDVVRDRQQLPGPSPRHGDPQKDRNRLCPSAHERLAALIGGMPPGSVDALAEALELRRATLVSSSVGLSQIRGLSQQSAMRTARVFAELGRFAR